MNALTLIVKVTRRCNLRCLYCNDWRDGASPVMGTDVLQALIQKAVTDSSSRYSHFVWHGGEPTLVPLEFYETAMAYQEEAQRPGQFMANTIQTNGTVLTDEWLEFLKRHRFRVGVSLDGPPELHDRMRPTAGGRASHGLVQQNIGRLKESGIPVAVLMVLTGSMIALGAERLWHYLVSEGLHDVDLIPVRPPNNPANQLTVVPQGVKVDEYGAKDDWTQFLCELFDLWWSSTAPVRINTFDSIVRKLLGASPRSCLISGGCMGHFFGIEPSGDAYICGLYEDLKEYVVGNVQQAGFSDFRAGPQFKALVQQNETRLQGQSSCSNYSICSGGCPHEAFLAMRYSGHDAYAMCCGWGEYIDHIKGHLEAVDRESTHLDPAGVLHGALLPRAAPRSVKDPR